MKQLFVLVATSTAVAQGKFISYQVDDVRYEGYFTSPQDKAPLILLVHDWDGLTDYEIKRSEMLGGLGYAVFAVDLFKTKILVFHGTADTAITMEEFAQLAKQLEAHQISHEMITYGGAPHAFSVFGDERYREDADKKSWTRFLAFVRETVGSKP